MVTRTVAQKMGVQEGWRAHFIDAPAATVAGMGLPDLERSDELDGAFDYLHLFVVTQDQMRTAFPDLVPHVAPQGKLWVSWPKGRRLGSDLTLPTVIAIGYAAAMVESTCLSLDATWSGLRFTHPRPGQVYANSYGTLPDQRR